MIATWSKEEAAYLAVGEDPDHSKQKISPKGTNRVSKCFYWLKARQREGKFGPDDVVNGVEKVNTGDLFRLLRDKYEFDTDMGQIFCKIRYGKPPKRDILSPSVYRRAGQLIFEAQHAKGSRPSKGDVATVLEQLYENLSNSESMSLLAHHLHAANKKSHHIEEYLAGLSLLGPGEKRILTAPISVEWHQVIDHL